MRIIEGLDALREFAAEQSGDGIAANSVVVVGVFDGMHLGHQRLMHELLEMATELQAAPTVITFANHPDTLISGRRPEPIISVNHRLRLLRRAGAQRVLLLTFDGEIRDLTAEQFATQVLAQGLRTKGLLLGFDSAMGRNREGTPARFTELGTELGFVVREGKPVAVDGQTVSSTAIRGAIHSGDLDLASRLLGRRPTALGEVVHGDGRGRGLGFPTANVQTGRQALPPPGVYAVEILWEGEQYHAVANLGTRPTFTSWTSSGVAGGEMEPDKTLEVHVLDQDPTLDLYGTVLEVEFVRHLRDERKFDDVFALRAQIAADILTARQVLGS